MAPGTNPSMEPGTEPGMEPGTEPVTHPSTEPGTDPRKEPSTDAQSTAWSLIRMNGARHIVWYGAWDGTWHTIRHGA